MMLADHGRSTLTLTVFAKLIAEVLPHLLPLASIVMTVQHLDNIRRYKMFVMER